MNFGLKIANAPLHKCGFYEARPRDVLDAPSILVVDVRPYEDLLGAFGHIEGAVSRPVDELESRGLADVSRTAPVAVVCNNGRESRRCAEVLHSVHGFVEVYHLVGGMVRWCAEECPVSHRNETIGKVE